MRARAYMPGMSSDPTLSDAAAWAAFERRDRAWDGRVVGAVTTTGIYCKPSCPARRPKREHVVFYADADAARAAGYRACLRCKPDAIGRDRIAVAEAVALIEAAEDMVPLDEIAARVGYAPHHFHRLFKRATGVTPAAYARGIRARRAARALTEETSVTQAIYEAGYSAPSRFYETSNARLGMTPSVWKRGGAGVTIRWTVADTSLGPLLIAATDRGLCRVAFDEDSLALARRFPAAEIVSGGAALARAGGARRRRGRDAGAPHRPAGRRAGNGLPGGGVAGAARDPRGRDAQLCTARRRGGQRACRACRGTACGANHVSIVIPCHRAQRSDGTMGGYAYGIDRKIVLRRREGVEE